WLDMDGKRPTQRDYRRHVNDCSPTTFDQFRNPVATAEKGSQQIQGLGMLPDLHVHVRHPGILHHRSPGTVVEDIQPAIALDGFLDCVLDTRFLGHIRFDKGSLAPSLTHSLLAGSSQLGFEFSDDYMTAFLGQEPGCRPSHTGA